MSTEHDMILVPLDITQTLIDDGIREDCENCPVALAFTAACPGALGINVTRSFVGFSAGGGRHKVDMPWDARNFVDAIDDEFAVEPQVLVIPIPRSIAALPGFLADETLLSPRALEPMPL